MSISEFFVETQPVGVCVCVCVCVCMPKEINIWNYSQVNERVHEFQIWTCDKCKLGQELTSGLGSEDW